MRSRSATRTPENHAHRSAVGMSRKQGGGSSNRERWWGSAQQGEEGWVVIDGEERGKLSGKVEDGEGEVKELISVGERGERDERP